MGEVRLVDSNGQEAERTATILVDAGEQVSTRENLRHYLSPTPTHGSYR